VKAEFEVEDFDLSATTLAQTNLRNLIGDKTLDETLTARDSINNNLRDVLDEATHGWGVKVTRVEVQKIDPPAEITEAMSLQMKAEREKRAAILTAEGQKQSQLLQAEGEGQSKIIKAKADADSIKLVSEAANKYFNKNAQEWQKLSVSREVLAHNTKYVIPTSADLVSILNLEGETKIIPVAKK
jgi:regulator of protease activity HflC (stomatin/prohibitin superfamily)